MKNQHIELIPPDTSLAWALSDYYTRNRDFLRAFEPAREERTSSRLLIRRRCCAVSFWHGSRGPAAAFISA